MKNNRATIHHPQPSANVTDVCTHLTGYWINKAKKNFRCYGCLNQFHIGDNLPAKHPTKGIVVWRGDI